MGGYRLIPTVETSAQWRIPSFLSPSLPPLSSCLPFSFFQISKHPSTLKTRKWKRNSVQRICRLMQVPLPSCKPSHRLNARWGIGPWVPWLTRGNGVYLTQSRLIGPISTHRLRSMYLHIAVIRSTISSISDRAIGIWSSICSIGQSSLAEHHLKFRQWSAKFAEHWVSNVLPWILISGTY